MFGLSLQNPYCTPSTALEFGLLPSALGGKGSQCQSTNGIILTHWGDNRTFPALSALRDDEDEFLGD